MKRLSVILLLLTSNSVQAKNVKKIPTTQVVCGANRFIENSTATINQAIKGKKSQI